MPPVRPSSLQLAEKCARAPWLSARYREENAATEEGNAVDVEVTIALTGGPAPTKFEAIECHRWARETFPADAVFMPQHRITLTDPNSDEVITAGTPDLLVVFTTGGRKRLVVVDWKKKGQLYSGYLTQPDDNLQQLAYLVGGGMEIGVDEGQVILACFDERGVTPIVGSVHPADAWWPMLDRIKKVPQVDLTGPEPTATKGDHCDACWQKLHCSAFLLPAMQEVPVALVPFTEGGQISEARALEALAWLERAEGAISLAKKIRDQVEDQLQTFAITRGPIRDEERGREWGPMQTNGRRSGPSVKELESLGLTNLIKTGEPGMKFSWRKAG